VDFTSRRAIAGVLPIPASNVWLLTDRGGKRALNLDKSAASRRVAAAVEADYLRNLEDRRGRPARPGAFRLPLVLARLGAGVVQSDESGE